MIEVKDEEFKRLNRNTIDSVQYLAPRRTEVEDAVSTFSKARGGAVAVEMNPKTGGPKRLTGLLSTSLGGNKVEVSRQFLSANAGVFGLQPDLSDSVEDDVFGIGGLHYVRYKQTYQNMPVFGGETVVSIDDKNTVKDVQSNHFLQIDASFNPKITMKKAVSAAMKDLGPSARFRDKHQTTTVWYPTKDGFTAAYHILLPTESPLGDWRYAIDVRTGDIIDSYNEMRFCAAVVPQTMNLNIPPPPPPPLFIYYPGRGHVYLEDPVKTPVPATVMMRNLNFPYFRLNGRYTNVLNDDTTEAVMAANRSFYYAPGDTHFDEAQMYYAVERSYAYFRSLEFRGFSRLSRNNVITSTVHYGTSYDNAFYSPAVGQLFFGDGSGPPRGLNDLAKETDVVTHEFTHAVIDEMRPGIGGTDGAALHEGTADYFAASLTNDHVMGEYVLQPGGIRDLQNNLRYPGPSTEPHTRGLIWGGACWDLRNRIGPETADFLVFASIPLWPAAPTFKDAKDAILSVDFQQCGQEYAQIIRTIFETNRGIPA